MSVAVVSGLRGAVVLACVLITLLVGGHDLRLFEPGHDHGSAAIAGLCFVVLGVVATLIVGARPPRPARVVRNFRPAPLLPSPARRLRGSSARASPAWLQRFQN